MYLGIALLFSIALVCAAPMDSSNGNGKRGGHFNPNDNRPSARFKPSTSLYNLHESTSVVKSINKMIEPQEVQDKIQRKPPRKLLSNKNKQSDDPYLHPNTLVERIWNRDENLDYILPEEMRENVMNVLKKEGSTEVDHWFDGKNIYDLKKVKGNGHFNFPKAFQL